VDNGPDWAVVRLATAREVLELQPDLSRIPAAMVGAIGAYPRGGEHAFELRTFAPARYRAATASLRADGWTEPETSRSQPTLTARRAAQRWRVSTRSPHNLYTISAAVRLYLH
jgi:hypothetical protein